MYNLNKQAAANGQCLTEEEKKDISGGTGFIEWCIGVYRAVRDMSDDLQQNGSR